MRIIATEKQIYAGIMGLAVGDALGVPYEFRKRDTFKCEGMTGWGTHNQPPGTWSDDTSLTLATMASLIECGKVDPKDIMQKFSLWYTKGYFTAHGDVFDCGGATGRAIQKYLSGTPYNKCGGKGFEDNGNGALMRILPLAFVDNGEKYLNAVGGLTHAHRISRACCWAYISAAKAIMDDKKLEVELPYFRSEIKSSGYVVDTLKAAFWCLLNTDTYRDCVLTAVNMGEDTDTTAAVAGGLAGLFYGVGGERGIPEEWINQIARKEYIKELCEQMAAGVDAE